MADLAGTILGEIVERRRERLEEAKARVPLNVLRDAAEARSDFRDFARAIAGAFHHPLAPSSKQERVREIRRGPLRVIAELKRASPSRGILRRDYRRQEIARGYEAAEASALSVLTEQDYFLGSLDDLAEVHEAVKVPVLRKDFILDDYQVYESVAAGADALLLIAAALDDAELRRLHRLAAKLGVAALVEVHTEEELARALSAGARLVGVNNRDLKTMEVDLGVSLRLAAKMPRGNVTVSESGIKTSTDLKKLAEAGYDAVLIGERFLTAPDPGRELAEFLRVEGSLARART